MSSNDSSQSTRRVLSRNRPTDSSSSSSAAAAAAAASEELSSSSSRSKTAEHQSTRNHGLKPPPTLNPAVVSPAVLPKDNKENSGLNETLSQTLSYTQQSQAQNSLAINYINKEPFNEDIDLEETSLLTDNKWRLLVIDKFKELIDEIKKLQSNPIDNKGLIKEKYTKGLLLCTTIKKLNRISHIKVNRARIKTHEEKNKIDEYHLELQNLLYEISYLKKEINKCLEFRSLHEDIILMPLEEFYAKAPAEISNQQVTRTNEHKLKLAQLDWELIERQNMTARIKELENLIDLHEKQLKLKQNKLESLHPKLNQILEACKPTLEYFNTNFEDDCHFSEIVQYLPKPLYQFYMMISAYKDTIDKEITKVEVCGDLDEAKSFNLNDTILLEDDDSGGDSGNEDENDTENYKKKKSKSKSIKKKCSNTHKLFNCFPLSVKVLFCIEGYGQFTLEFFYLNILKIITLKSDIKFQKEIQFSATTTTTTTTTESSTVLKQENIFNCLYENDNGLESPNLANKFLLSNMGIQSIEPYLKEMGSPFRWCQMLCGLYYESKLDRQSLIYEASKIQSKTDDDLLSDMEMADSAAKSSKQESESEDIIIEDTESSNEESLTTTTTTTATSYKSESKLFEQIIIKLKSRFKSRVTLQETLNSMRSLVIPQSSFYSLDKLKFKVQSSILSFKEITFDKYVSLHNARLLLDQSDQLSINETECCFFELTLKNLSANLLAHIVINQNYPRVYPLFVITINWKHERNNLNDEAIRDMERELNIYKEFDYLEGTDMSSSRSIFSHRKSNQFLFKHSSHDDLFAKQINHLIVCFDIYLESESYYLNDLEYQRVKLFPQSVRGRDRKRPFSYFTAKDMFIQRLQFKETKD